MWPKQTHAYHCHHCHHCHHCQRPLARYTWQREPKVYRIFSVIAAARVVTTVAGALLLFVLIAFQVPLSSLAAAVAVQFALYGATDITDGVLGLGSNVDRTAKQVRTGTPARRHAWGKIAFGAVNWLMAAFGFLVVRGAS